MMSYSFIYSPFLLEDVHLNTLCAITIYAVRHNGEAAMAGDGQVTLGEQVIMKQTARKVILEQVLQQRVLNYR
jgi:ATP-dependent protease HslVU (ClpYQ) peptidase subunit